MKTQVKRKSITRTKGNEARNRMGRLVATYSQDKGRVEIWKKRCYSWFTVPPGTPIEFHSDMLFGIMKTTENEARNRMGRLVAKWYPEEGVIAISEKGCYSWFTVPPGTPIEFHSGILPIK